MSKNSKSCVVFDFDTVLTKHHLYHAIMIDGFTEGLNERKIAKWGAASKCLARGCLCFTDPQKAKILPRAHDYVRWFFGGPKRIQQLEKFFKTLARKHVDVYIASLGNLEIIMTALQGLNSNVIYVEKFKQIYGTMPAGAGHVVYDTKTKRFRNYRDRKKPKSKKFTKDKFIETLLKKYKTGGGGGAVVYIDDNENFYNKTEKLGANVVEMETQKGMTTKDMKQILSYL